MLLCCDQTVSPQTVNLEIFSDSESEAVIAQNQDSSGSWRASLMSLESESSSTSEDNSRTELGRRKHQNKGKASINARAVMKNGRYRTSSVILSSSDDSNSDDVQLKNSDSCHGNSVECVSQESQSSTKSWKDYLGQESGLTVVIFIGFNSVILSSFIVAWLTNSTAVDYVITELLGVNTLSLQIEIYCYCSKLYLSVKTL